MGGRQCRSKDHITQRSTVFLEKNVSKVRKAQAYFERYLVQEKLIQTLFGSKQDKAATVIQARWRGWLGRRHVEALREEVLWPMKSWFEYFPLAETLCRS